jgi:TolB-like protein
MSFFDELKRRNVFRIAIAYIILAWLMAQVAELLLGTFGAPDWVLKSMLALFLVGFPFALFFAWAFELTPDGLRKEKDVDRSQSISPQTGHKLDRTIIGVLVVTLAYFAWDKFGAEPTQDQSNPVSTTVTPDTSGQNIPLANDKSIAVLPFENRSNQQDDEFFTSGIHDDLLTQLAQISSLRVISRTSMTQFKDTTKSIREIAKLLGVATILEGGVQRAGNQVRINMQLIDAATDAHLWAQTYDRELTANNIFAIQSEIATAVTEAMRATLSPEEQVRIAEVPTQNMQALEEYFKGRAELDQRTLPALESARMRFENARQLDPGFALALAGEALAIQLLSDSSSAYGDIPTNEVIALARPLLERAIKIAPDDPQVLGVFGLLEGNDNNFAAERDYYQRSLELNPSSGEVLNWSRMALSSAGRMKESVEMTYRMVEVDPMSMIALYNGIAVMADDSNADPDQIERLALRLSDLDLAYGTFARATVAIQRGDIPTAIKLHYQVLELDPGRSSNRANLFDLLAPLGLTDEAAKVSPSRTADLMFWTAQWEDAIQIYREVYERNPASIDASSNLMSTLYMAGQVDEAFSMAENLWERFSDNPHQIGFLHMDMANLARKTEHPAESRLYRDAAALWLQRSVEVGNVSGMRYLTEAHLAAYDHREDDAVKAISLALDHGVRWHYFLKTPQFEDMKDNPEFQAQASRMRDLIETENGEIVAMLCGPDSVLTTWQPAAGTCN